MTHEYSQHGQHDVIIQHSQFILCKRRTRVQSHHQRAVERVEQAHARGEEDREDEDEPEGGALGSAEGTEPEEGDFGGGVEAEAEEDAEGVHFVGAVLGWVRGFSWGLVGGGEVVGFSFLGRGGRNGKREKKRTGRRV